MSDLTFLEKIKIKLQKDKKKSLFITAVTASFIFVISTSLILFVALSWDNKVIEDNKTVLSLSNLSINSKSISDSSINSSIVESTSKTSSIGEIASSLLSSIANSSTNSNSLTVSPTNVPEQIYQRIISVQFPSDDIPLISASVLDFGAKINDDTDDSDAIQSAIYKTYKKFGGGTVFLPSGKYVIKKPIIVSPNVRLRGEWSIPTPQTINKGTIIYAYHGKNDATGLPLFQADEAAAITNITIYYPEQTIDAVIPYSPTIGPISYYGSQFYNITLINSYKGISVNTHNAFNIKNIYGTVLKEGVYIDNVLDIGRLQNIHFDSKYWQMFDNKVSLQSITNYTRLNTIGFTYGRCDWAYMYDCSISNANKGFLFTSTKNGQANGQFSYVKVDKCIIGIDINDLAVIGAQMSNSEIRATGPNSIAIKGGNNFGGNETFMFNNCKISSEGTGVLNEKDGVLMFAFCDFENWKNSNYAIDFKQGALIADNCKFLKANNHIFVGDLVNAATVVGNNFTGNPVIQNLAGSKLVVDHKAISITPKNTMTKPINLERKKPTKLTLFNLENYKITQESDISDALIKGLQDASKNGGGIVYIPAGRYKVEKAITIPTGVELRGINDFSKHFGATKKGTVLETSFGKGSANGKSLITLSKNSGISGLSVFYPDQNYKTNVVYSPTIASGGDGFWIYNVNTPNAYLGVKVTHSNFHIDYLRGLGLNTCISFDNASKGYITDLMVSGGDWQDGIREKNAPPPDLWKTFPNYENTAVKINNSSNLVFVNAFSFGMGTGIELNGNSSNNLFYGHGVDAARTGVLLSGSGSGNYFMNTEIVAADNYIKTSLSYSGKSFFYNTDCWMNGYKASSIFEGSGTVNIQQYKQLTGSITLKNGITNIQNLFLHSYSPKVTFEAKSKNSSITNSLMTGSKFNIVDNTGGNIINKNNNIKKG